MISISTRSSCPSYLLCAVSSAFARTVSTVRASSTPMKTTVKNPPTSTCPWLCQRRRLFETPVCRTLQVEFGRPWRSAGLSLPLLIPEANAVPTTPSGFPVLYDRTNLARGVGLPSDLPQKEDDKALQAQVIRSRYAAVVLTITRKCRQKCQRPSYAHILLLAHLACCSAARHTVIDTALIIA